MKQSVLNSTAIFEIHKVSESLSITSLWKPRRMMAWELLMTSWVKVKQSWQWAFTLKVWSVFIGLIRGLGYLLFVAPPQQEMIELARVKALQYRGLF